MNGSPENWFSETLHGTYEQRFEVTNILHHSETAVQDIIIFETPFFGRVLALDGIIQTTERDEACYHEMLAHVPIFAHGSVQEVLIIGGGDGGALREVLRHTKINMVTIVEIDGRVVELCQKFLPALSKGAFQDPRCNLLVSDGVEFVKMTDRRFDLIIVDSSDPIGPSVPLFSDAFYCDCRDLLTEDGIFICQSGVSFVQETEARETIRRLNTIFTDAALYVTQVPTYSFGFMALGWGAQSHTARNTEIDTIRTRFNSTQLDMRYYSPQIHTASFALPAYMHY